MKRKQSGVYSTADEALQNIGGRYYAYRVTHDADNRVVYVVARSLEHAMGVAAKHWGFGAEPVTKEALPPDASPEDLIRYINNALPADVRNAVIEGLKRSRKP